MAIKLTDKEKRHHRQRHAPSSTTVQHNNIPHVCLVKDVFWNAVYVPFSNADFMCSICAMSVHVIIETRKRLS
jgi:hypothetical protein